MSKQKRTIFIKRPVLNRVITVTQSLPKVSAMSRGLWLWLWLSLWLFHSLFLIQQPVLLCTCTLWMCVCVCGKSHFGAEKFLTKMVNLKSNWMGQITVRCVHKESALVMTLLSENEAFVLKWIKDEVEHWFSFTPFRLN